MKCTCLCIAVWLCGFGSCMGMSQRKIYNLFTATKTWNEAHAICESQFGQLVKIQGQGHIEELKYLSENEWSDRITQAPAFWSGLHKPFANNTWEYQDCESLSADMNFVNNHPDGRCATFVGLNYDLSEANCSMENIFICQRYEGDCWYEPFIGETYSSPIYETDTLSVGLEHTECAMECRSRIIGGDIECWGFLYDPSGAIGCQLLFLDVVSASSMFLTTRKTPLANSDMIFYVRRCFEGTFDTRIYSEFHNSHEEPQTNCTTTPHTDGSAVTDICFCSTQEQPPIPEPVSCEEKAKQYAANLSINSANTGAAVRKLISAEDNRPSAVGVGFFGVGILTMVFGGMVLMDINILYAGFKEFFCR